MKRTKLNRNNFVHAITPEQPKQIKEFAHMSPRDRLRWLEKANAFINKAVGLEARAKWDERFEEFL